MGLVLLAGLVVTGGASTALAARALGVDVSHWQDIRSQAEWTQAKNSGRVFAMIRATHYYTPDELLHTGDKGMPDDCFVANMDNAHAAGVLTGAYHYSRPELRTPQVEAEFFLSAARPYLNPGWLRPMHDIESGEGAAVGAANLTDWCNQWINYVEQQTGVVSMVYVNYDYTHNHLNSAIGSRTLVWARWSCPTNINTAEPDDPNHTSYPYNPPFPNWTMWQYCGGIVPGISDNDQDKIDLDVFNGTTTQLQTLVIAPRGTIALSPTPLACSVRQRRNAADQTFTIRNANQSWYLSYTVAPGTYTSVSPNTGSCNNTAVPATVSYVTQNLPVGTTNTSITVTAPLATNSPEVLPITITVTPIPGDLSHDGCIDATDADQFLNCMTGTGISLTEPGCFEADLDGDNDADQSDFAVMQNCFSGTGIAADPNCAP